MPPGRLIRFAEHGNPLEVAPMGKNLAGVPEESKPKLLDQVRDVIRFKHYSIRTEATYLQWIYSMELECG